MSGSNQNTSFTQMSEEFGKIIQQETDNVYNHAKSLMQQAQAVKDSSSPNGYNTEILSAMVNQLNIVTQALMNAEKTYKAAFDSINRNVQ